MNDNEDGIYGLKPGDFAAEKHQIKLSLLITALEEINIDELKKVGSHFQQNLTMVNDMISLPHEICTILEAESHRTMWHIIAGIKSGVSCPRKADEKGRDKFEEEMKKIYAEEVESKKDKFIDELIEEGDRTAFRLLKEERQKASYEAILRSGLVLIWCNFEVFMRDLWETSVNIGGNSVIQNILRGLDKSSNEKNSPFIQGKSISLEYLARFNYDLSNKLGTALLYKFDFTSLFNIKEAFVSAFPRSETIKQALASTLLLELSAKRNVIVHNSCIIDEEYCFKLGLSKELIGQELIIGNDDVSRLGNAVVDSGIKVLSAVFSIITAG